jgi:hypothetical protein
MSYDFCKNSPDEAGRLISELKSEIARLKEDKDELHRMAWRLARALNCSRGHGFKGGSAELADRSFYKDYNGELPNSSA